MADTKLETSDANVESHWQTFSRRLVEAAALSRSLVATPRLPTMLQSPLSRLRTPLTRLLGKQRRLCTGPEDSRPRSGGTNNHVCLPGAAWDHVLRRGQLTPHTLARVALADAWSAARVAEVCSLEDSWESWAALSPRPTKMDVEHLLSAFTLKLRPDRAIDRLQVIEKALNEYDTKAICFEGRNMPGSWVDEGLSGSMAQILGKVVCAPPGRPTARRPLHASSVARL